MYSLYRAWFGDSVTGDNYSRLQETLSPPDTVIRVGNEGEHQFVAHKGVLAAHSGYLKALLTSAAATSNQNVSTNVGSCSNLPATAIAVTTTNASEQALRQPVTSVSVSSIGGEAFAPLLNYMYTGRLEVTLDNVYSVLLATHLLHMPGALEQCRAALFRLRAPVPLPTPIPVPAAPTSTLTSTSMSSSTPGSGNILRPIPNRLMIDPTMCWPTTQFYQPTAPHLSHLTQLQPSVLMQSTVPLNVSVVPTSSLPETQNSTRYSEIPSPKSSTYQTDRTRNLRELKQKPSEDVFSAAFTAFSASTSTTSPTLSVSPTSSPMSQSSLPTSQSKKSGSTDQRQSQEDDYEQSKTSSRQTQERASSLTPLEESTSNRHHERSIESLSIPETDRSKSKRRGRGSAGNEGSSSGVLSVVYDVACCDGPVRFHRVLNENYSSSASCGTSTIPPPRLQRPCFEPENVTSENDENGGPGPGVRTPCDSIESNIETTTNSGSYTCGYCRHTFKSQYCYRKHAKRHLLSSRTNNSMGNRQRQEVARNRREVRLLDLNVQYYPCKICGCKFPSYYFVHKHRKLCHANIEDRSQNEEASGNAAEDQESMTSTTTERQ
ncbi:uncharacterized protein LOC143186088 [Calliopsis andreniformis]|uniref:uncharacterized protein LOC143186088 n=1 Tax=Calliopsis andreniformis TaxID=337506 RepID=UPI003FCD6994